MKSDSCKGDWINLVKDDLENVGMSLDNEADITKMTKQEFKKFVKQKVRENTFNNLNEIKEGHKKVKDIVHNNLNKPQAYITSSLLDNKEKALLFNLRSKSVNEYKENFTHKYNNTNCPMCNLQVDSQEHALACYKVTQHLDSKNIEILKLVTYHDLFSSLDRQVQITRIFQQLLNIRQKLLKNKQQQDSAHHGFVVDPMDDT